MRFFPSVCFGVAAVSAVLALPVAQAQTTFNFDTTSGGAPTTQGATINSQYGGAGVTFTSNAVIQVGPGTTSQPNFASSTNFLGSVSAVFDSPVDFVSAQNVTFSSFTLSAFSASNVLLGSTFVSGFSGIGAGNSGPGYAFISSPGQIKSVTFSSNGQFGFDDFRFSPSITAVPEPSEWLAMGMAAASVGGLMLRARRRKISATIAA